MKKQIDTFELENKIIKLNVLVNLLDAWAGSSSDTGEVCFISEAMQKAIEEIDDMLN